MPLYPISGNKAAPTAAPPKPQGKKADASKPKDQGSIDVAAGARHRELADVSSRVEDVMQKVGAVHMYEFFRSGAYPALHPCARNGHPSISCRDSVPVFLLLTHRLLIAPCCVACPFLPDVPGPALLPAWGRQGGRLCAHAPAGRHQHAAELDEERRIRRGIRGREGGGGGSCGPAVCMRAGGTTHARGEAQDGTRAFMGLSDRHLP